MFQAFSSTFTSISPALRERGRVWEKVDGTLLGRGVACGRAGEACGRAGSRLAGRAGARRAGVTCGRAGAGRAGSAGATIQGIQVYLLGREITTYSCTLAWKILWTASLVGYSPWGGKEL